jgi:hypothetical protein
VIAVGILLVVVVVVVVDSKVLAGTTIKTLRA